MESDTLAYDFQELRRLIANDQLEKVCNLLESEREAIAIKGRLKNLDERDQRGILEEKEYKASRNKIRENLLNLIDRIEKGGTAPRKKSLFIASCFIGLAILLAIGWINWPAINNSPLYPALTNSQSPFSPNDSTNFNILILRFEDYIAGGDTYCIGRAIEEQLNVIQANENLPLTFRTYYADSIPPPKTIEEAQNIQKQYHADLIIYGLARKVQEGCAGAEVCFRYNIAEHVIAQIAPVVDIKTTKHDLNYTPTTPMAIEKGVLQIDNLSLKHWLISLMNVKANKPEEAFLELDKIGADSSLNSKEKAKRFLNIGNTYYGLQQYTRAIKAYDKAIELNPDDGSAYYNRGTSFLRSNQYDRAIQDFDKVIKLIPDYASTYYYRGACYAKLKQYDRAIQDFDKAIELNPDDDLVYNNRGNSFFQSNQYERAIQDYDKAIELNPDDDLAYNNRGACYGMLKQYKRAIQDSDKAIELNPGDASSYNNRGFSYNKSKQYDLAIQDYDKAIELNPDNASAYNNRGASYGNLKQYKRAIQDFDRAIELDPDDVSAYYNRGFSHGKLKQHERAIQDFDKAIELNPDDENIYNIRGAYYGDLKQYERAIQDFDKAIELNPDEANAYSTRGIYYSKLNHYERAIQNFDKAIELNPNNAYYYNNQANTYRKTGALKKAKAGVQKSLSLDDDNGWAYATLAMIHADEGNLALFYKNCEIAITKPLAYPLKEQLEEEETLQKFRNDPIFLQLLNQSEK